jgi:hypothetical protein
LMRVLFANGDWTDLKYYITKNSTIRERRLSAFLSNRKFRILT